MLMIKIIVKLKTIVIIQVNAEVLHIACVIQNILFQKKLPVVFHNGLNDDYHFIIKELAKEFHCLGENTEKYKIFSLPTTKEVKSIDENGEEIMKTIFCKL